MKEVSSSKIFLSFLSLSAFCPTSLTLVLTYKLKDKQQQQQQNHKYSRCSILRSWIGIPPMLRLNQGMKNKRFH